MGLLPCISSSCRLSVHKKRRSYPQPPSTPVNSSPRCEVRMSATETLNPNNTNNIHIHICTYIPATYLHTYLPIDLPTYSINNIDIDIHTCMLSTCIHACIHNITQHNNIHNITLDYTTLHSIPLHSITLRYIAFTKIQSSEHNPGWCQMSQTCNPQGAPRTTSARTHVKHNYPDLKGRRYLTVRCLGLPY